MTILSRLRQRRKVWLGLGLAWLATTVVTAVAQPRGTGRIALAEVEGAIDPGSGDFIRSAIAQAEKQDYAAIVIRLDTPGGLVDTTREIVQAELESAIPVIVYVAPGSARAGSAGVFITLAAHVAAMAPATNIGAAHPVSLGGGGEGPRNDDGPRHERSQEEIMAEKVENDLAAFAEAIAQQRGRNVEWAVKAVRKSESVPASKALELGVIDLVATSLDELLEKVDGRTVKVGAGGVETVLRTKGLPVDTIDWSWKQRFLHIIGDPNVASILMSLGVLGLALEFYKPGAIVPGVVGAISLVLGVVGMSALPVNVGAVLLLVIGLGLIVAEVFVSAFGLLGVAGVIAFSAGAVLLVENIGTDFFADADFGVSLETVLPTAIFSAILMLVVGWKAVAAWRLKPQVGSSGLVGEIGTVDVAIGEGQVGKVFVHGELWNAVAEAPLETGARAKVLAVDGLTIKVGPA